MALVTKLYRGGKQRLHPEGWTGRGDDEVLLIAHGTGWSWDIDHVSLTSLILGTTELVADGYARLSVTPSTPTWSSPRWSLPMAALVWSALGVDEDVAAVVGFQAGVSDASSVPLWAVFDDDGDPIETLDGTDLTVTVDLGTT